MKVLTIVKVYGSKNNKRKPKAIKWQSATKDTKKNQQQQQHPSMVNLRSLDFDHIGIQVNYAGFICFFLFFVC